MDALLAATEHGLVRASHADGAWYETAHWLSDHPLTCVAARRGEILAGARDGILRSEDDGTTWEEASTGLKVRHVRWLAYYPDRAAVVLAGTEPAAIHVSHDGGRLWRDCDEVTALRDAHGWYLPYAPEAGCVRGFAFHGARAYAAAEQGGVLRSDDGGETWDLAEGSDGDPRARPAAGSVHPDVHAIYTHPVSPDFVLAATGGGLYRSHDGGKAWRCLYACYIRAAWVDPEDPNHLVAGPADGVDAGGRIEETTDGGRTWRLASTGLQVPWRQHMVERFAQVGPVLLAVLSNGKLCAAPLATLAWEQVLPHLGGIRAVTAVREDRRGR